MYSNYCSLDWILNYTCLIECAYFCDLNVGVATITSRKIDIALWSKEKTKDTAHDITTHLLHFIQSMELYTPSYSVVCAKADATRTNCRQQYLMCGFKMNVLVFML